eukprot:m.19860 g.19860  ORF g.19860 m.19860 type:complete len:347 (-) comp5179_c0_seq1:109-1149(-)
MSWFRSWFKEPGGKAVGYVSTAGGFAYVGGKVVEFYFDNMKSVAREDRQKEREQNEKKKLEEATSLETAKKQMASSSEQLLSRYPLHPEHTYAPNDRLERAIKGALDTFKMGGVLVLHAPQHSGKSAALREVVRGYQKTKRFNAILLRKLDITKEDGITGEFTTALQDACGVPHDSKATWLPDFFELPPNNEPKNIIILDQFDDDLPYTASATELRGFVTSLATTAQANKLIVLIGVSDDAYARTMLACNGGTKIRSIWRNIKDGKNFKWLEEELVKVLDKHYQEDILFHELVDEKARCKEGNGTSEVSQGKINQLFREIVGKAKRPRVGEVLEAKEAFIRDHRYE